MPEANASPISLLPAELIHIIMLEVEDRNAHGSRDVQCLQDFSLASMTIQADELLAIIEGLPHPSQLKSFRLDSVYLLDGSWAPLLEAMREKFAPHGVNKTIVVQLNELSGAEFEMDSMLSLINGSSLQPLFEEEALWEEQYLDWHMDKLRRCSNHRPRGEREDWTQSELYVVCFEKTNPLEGMGNEWLELAKEFGMVA